jgi:hypothetical protein
VDAGMSNEFIRAELAKHKIPNADIRPIAPSLEDVFVALTNNSTGDGKPPLANKTDGR